MPDTPDLLEPTPQQSLLINQSTRSILGWPIRPLHVCIRAQPIDLLASSLFNRPQGKITSCRPAVEFAGL
jgi:hypothetical protein